MTMPPLLGGARRTVVSIPVSCGGSYGHVHLSSGRRRGCVSVGTNSHGSIGFRPNLFVRGTQVVHHYNNTGCLSRSLRQLCVCGMAKPDDGAFIKSPESLSSDGLDSSVRVAVEDAIRARGYAVTVGDVAAEAGVSVRQAQEAISALALDSKATLKVSKEGEIVYEFSRSFKDVIRGASFKIRVLEPASKAVVNIASYIGRIAFGVALFSSLAIVTVAFSVLSSSNNRDGDDSRRVSYSTRSSPMYFNMMDLWWYFDPWYYSRRRAYMYGDARGPQGMGFLESIFSCVFGDGDPNEEFPSQRWNALGRYIQSRGGVVTAEELAPFLDASSSEFRSAVDSDGVVVQESFVLPALTIFGGEPVVTDDGNIVYVFPSLQTTAQRKPMPVPYDAVLEQEWTLTEATTGQKILVGALGALNVVGVVALSVALQNPRNLYVLAVNGLQGIVGIMPYLQAYALSFAVIPLVRWFGIQRKNAAIQDRNNARMMAAKSVMNPSGSLQKKLNSAGDKKKKIVLDTFVYDTSRPLPEDDGRMEESLDWDARFSRKHPEMND
jgi:hypothetical protein